MNAVDEEPGQPGRERTSARPRAGHSVRRLGDSPVLAAQSLDRRWLLTRLRAFLGDPPIEFAVRAGARVRRATVPVGRAGDVREPRAPSWRCWPIRRLRFGDAYSDGSVTVDGDLVSLLESVYRSSAAGAKPSLLRRGARCSCARPHRNTLRRLARQHPPPLRHRQRVLLAVARQHHGLHLRLLPDAASATLDEAQFAKMDHVCRKLRLQAGESVVEAGCGWGTLALHMARHYGVRVRAFNISREQVAYARERAAREGLAARSSTSQDDYRNISGHYDAFVSVGMLEHVGVANYGELGDVARRALGGRGRGLIHSIGRNYPAPLQPWIEKRIFPGAYPPSLGEMMRHLRALGTSRCSTWRTCACTTRRRCATG